MPKNDAEDLLKTTEDALSKLGEIHPHLPVILMSLSRRQEGCIQAIELLEKRAVVLDERLTRFEEMGGAAILKLKRLTDRLVRREKRAERRMLKVQEKAARKGK